MLRPRQGDRNGKGLAAAWAPGLIGVGLAAAVLVWAGLSRPTSAAVQESIRVAIVGDYGAAVRSAPEATAEAAVATQIAGWSPNYVVTTGDNN